MARSTGAGDGSYFSKDRNGRVFSAGCTRWEEITRCAVEHAAWNAEIGVPCEFFLLNPPGGRSGSALRPDLDFVRVDAAQVPPWRTDRLQQ